MRILKSALAFLRAFFTHLYAISDTPGGSAHCPACNLAESTLVQRSAKRQ